MGIAITLHILSVVIWVGGMFFAYLALRPALADQDALSRARIWAAVFKRFFPWVWASIVVLLATGFYMILVNLGGFAQAPMFVQVMMGLGILMMLLFAHVFFAPYKRLRRAGTAGDEAAAKKSMNQIRILIAVNLTLGVIVIIVAMTGTFSFFS
ncbi:MAG TPA: CopD family protein [Gammaproteobacteria bacterium]|nr:CopD family protein [Gammaproteobacteria bacterium]